MTTEEETTPAREPEAPKKARVAPRRVLEAEVAEEPKKSAKAPKKAKPAKGESAREGSKTAKLLDLLKRSGGASLKDIMKATNWRAHSVRGFLSGTIGKKMGLKVESTKTESGERSYSVKG